MATPAPAQAIVTAYSGSTSSIAATFGSATTFGNQIVVAVDWAGVSTHIVSVTDNKGNVYQCVADRGDTNGMHMAQYTAYVQTSGSSHQVTVTFSAAAQTLLAILELTPAVVAGSTSFLNVSTTTYYGAETSLTTGPNVFVYGTYAPSGLDQNTSTPGAGWTERYDDGQMYVQSLSSDIPVTGTRGVFTSSQSRTGPGILGVYQEPLRKILSAGGGFVPIRQLKWTSLRHRPWVMSDGLVAYWAGDDPSSRIGSSTLYSRTADIASPRVHTLNFGHLSYFPGRSYITQDTSLPFSLVAWFWPWPKTFDAPSYLLAAGVDDATDRCYAILHSSVAKIESALAGTATSNKTLVGPTHVVGVFTSTSQTLYVNGRAEASLSESVSRVAHSISSRYARIWNGSAWATRTPLTVAPAWDMRVYNRALSDNEVRTLHDSTRGWFETPKTQIVVPTSYAPAEPLPIRAAPAIRTSKRTEQRPTQFSLNRGSQQARDLVVWCPGRLTEVLSQTPLTVSNGTWANDPFGGSVVSAEVANARVSTTCADAWKVQAPVTLTAWVKLTGTPSAYSTFFGIAANLTDASPYHCLMLGVNEQAKYRLSWNIDNTFDYVTTTATITTGEWTLLVARCPLDTLPSGEDLVSFWLNGRKQALDQSRELFQGITYSASAALVVGDATSNNRNPQARIADVRLYKRALSQAEISALYDPGTRWELYWTPSRTTLHVVPSAYPGVGSSGRRRQ